MDPNAAIEELRHLSSQLNGDNDDDGEHSPIDVDRFVELWDGLDQWISNGGFLPKAWQGSATTAINRFSAHPDTCICNGTPHRRAMGCL